MSEQLPLRYDSKWVGSESWAVTLAHCCRIVSTIGLKEVAHRLDTQPSLLAHQLAERNGNRLSGEQVQSILGMSGDEKLAGAMVSSGGFKVVEAKPLTADQKLGRIEAAMAEWPEWQRRAFLEQCGLI